MSTAAFALPTHPTKVHPRTGLALQAVGFRANGQPIWPILGAAEGDDDWATVFEGKTPAEVKADLEAAQAAAEGKSGESPWDELFKDQDPTKVKEALDNSRKWETRAKGNKDKADAYDELVKKITGKEEDDADPEKLTASLTAAQREARDTKVELAVIKAAGKHEADPVLLADSRTFMASIADLDPAADDFSTQLDAAIKKAVDANAALKAVTKTRPRSVQQQGHHSEGKQGGVQAGAEKFHEKRRGRSSTTTS